MNINSRNFIWLVPFALLLTFPLWRIPLTAFLAPRGGYNPALAENRQNAHDFTMNTVHILHLEFIGCLAGHGPFGNDIKGSQSIMALDDMNGVHG
ncbi:MAG: hypothetical protein KJ985_10115, partial [Proteobacteria bacterium]|nr:hypothetical protein [Pseudomonadota bacterium]